MNTELTKLYASKWDQLVAGHSALKIDDDGARPAFPLLIYVDDQNAYRNADIKVMIFGQETNGWYGECEKSVTAIQELYDDFFNEGDCWDMTTPFWRGAEKFMELIRKKFPEKTIEVIWNNVVKIGKHAAIGMPSAEIYEVEKTYFQVIPVEVEILKPDVVLFLTGPDYDFVIRDNFGNLEVKELPDATKRQISKLELPGVRYSYRTYHPNYLWRNDIEDYFGTIVDDLIF
ncbi:MAG: hypothetical protein EOO88_13695 [Pedobacter sp.]|nr:MAG: hypothetical protein EOO88_13695 [Pedobacter sp.]